MRLSAALILLPFLASAQTKSPARFEVSWSQPLDGHVVLIVGTSETPEPRSSVGEGLDTQQIFGVDVNAARTAIVDGATLGYPRDTLAQVPAGDYYVQAVLNIYETFHRADGRTVKLPMDQGEGQHWNRKPGNLYSEPVKGALRPGRCHHRAHRARPRRFRPSSRPRTRSTSST